MSEKQTLELQGAVTINDFLDRELSATLKAAVDEMFATFSQCTAFTDEAFTFHFRERHTIWIGGLPAELKAIGKNPYLYAGLLSSIHDATHRTFGSEWTPLPGISFIRSHRSSATHLTWHIDADAANALEVAGGGDCINVWLPLHTVGRTIPSMDIVPGSHVEMRQRPLFRKDEVPIRSTDYVASIGKIVAPVLGLGDALVVDQYTLHRTQAGDFADALRISCEFRYGRSKPRAVSS